ncbi:unnamed protein product [Schistosoma curassoni]|uniref:Ovule protein n=1 Tax=Schistosoma curassoni TaxID=6186 RepID=A0A183KKQ2_9TREM|nr:unnamed protein product [Schistosoma curassoni]
MHYELHKHLQVDFQSLLAILQAIDLFFSNEMKIFYEVFEIRFLFRLVHKFQRNNNLRWCGYRPMLEFHFQDIL